MANTTASGSGSDFTSSLGRIYSIYTGGFIAFIVLMAILSGIGVPNRIIGYLFMGFTIIIYAVIGILSRTMQVGEYYVAGRRVPALYNGMATGADWMSAASFIGMVCTRSTISRTFFGPNFRPSGPPNWSGKPSELK